MRGPRDTALQNVMKVSEETKTDIRRMGDLIEDNSQRAARRSARQRLRKRFYQYASVGEARGEGGFPLLLDGKPVRTPSRRQLAARPRRLASATAEEWNVQEKVVDPVHMPLTRLANAIIDAWTAAPDPVAKEVANYLSSDLLFYRAQTPDSLVEQQTRAWDPVLAWANHTFGARFVLAQGVMHVVQPEQALAAASAGLPSGSWRLGALSAITTLTGSALLALALMHGAMEPEAVWAAAHVDEDWQMQKWGHDERAVERRAYRQGEFDAAVPILRALQV